MGHLDILTQIIVLKFIYIAPEPFYHLYVQVIWFSHISENSREFSANPEKLLNTAALSGVTEHPNFRSPAPRIGTIREFCWEFCFCKQPYKSHSIPV